MLSNRHGTVNDLHCVFKTRLKLKTTSLSLNIYSRGKRKRNAFTYSTHSKPRFTQRYLQI